VSKQLYVIAGPNGAGKTTFAREFLPHFAHCEEFVNADLIATGLSPFFPRGSAIQAGRLVLQRINELASKGTDFGFETTLSGKRYLSLLKRLRKSGYKIHLFFLWLPEVSLAINRVQDRVRQGGHSVPESDVRRRFYRGLKHLLVEYRPLLDEWIIFDNSGETPKKVAFGTLEKREIVDSELFEKLLQKAKIHEA
jgi:predicted ABC-type ATPase